MSGIPSVGGCNSVFCSPTHCLVVRPCLDLTCKYILASRHATSRKSSMKCEDQFPSLLFYSVLFCSLPFSSLPFLPFRFLHFPTLPLCSLPRHLQSKNSIGGFCLRHSPSYLTVCLSLGISLFTINPLCCWSLFVPCIWTRFYNGVLWRYPRVDMPAS